MAKCPKCKKQFEYELTEGKVVKKENHSPCIWCHTEWDENVIIEENSDVLEDSLNA